MIPGGSATGVLTLSNAGAAPVVVVVRPVASASSVTMPVTAATVPAGGSALLDFTVARADEGTGQDVVARFVVSYQNQVTVGTVTVKAAASPAIIEAKVESNVAVINENRPGERALGRS
jgi:hypothetical protein